MEVCFEEYSLIMELSPYSGIVPLIWNCPLLELSWVWLEPNSKHINLWNRALRNVPLIMERTALYWNWTFVPMGRLVHCWHLTMPNFFFESTLKSDDSDRSEDVAGFSSFWFYNNCSALPDISLSKEHWTTRPPQILFLIVAALCTTSRSHVEWARCYHFSLKNVGMMRIAALCAMVRSPVRDVLNSHLKNVGMIRIAEMFVMFATLCACSQFSLRKLWGWWGRNMSIELE